MPTREIQHRKDSQLFAQLCLALLREGHSVQFRVQGESMRPNILDGDAVLVAPAADRELCQGDIALVQNQDGLRVHRVASCDASSGAVVTRSDTGLASDPSASRMFGKVITLRRNSHEKSLTPLQTRFVHPLRVMLYRIRAAALLRFRRAALLLSRIVALSLLCATFLAPFALAQTDLQLAQTASAATIPVSTNYTYTEVVTNNGPNAVANANDSIVVYMQTPANTNFRSYAGTNWTCVNGAGNAPAAGYTGPLICTYAAALASGASTTGANALVITMQVNAGTASGTTILNSATVTSDTVDDSKPANNTSITSIYVEPAASADAALSMSVFPTPVFVSSSIAYTITVQNIGPASATGVTVADTLPASLTFGSATASQGTCSGGLSLSCALGTIAAGATATISVTLSTSSSATTLTNTATVTTTSTDSNATNNSATTYTVVQPISCANPGRDGAGGTLTGIVNAYFPGTTGTLAAGSNSVTLGAAAGAPAAQTPIAVGDLLLIIQMQDATINSNNTSSYGDGLPGDPGSGSTSLGSSGLFEFITATSTVPVTGGTLTFAGTGSSGGLLNSYYHLAASSAGTTYVAQQAYQVIRVPQYTSATLSSTLVPLAWNGSVGGVLVIDASSQLTLGGTVALDALGFRGGGAQLLTGPTTAGAVTDYVTVAPTSNVTTTGVNGSKGEGIAGTPRYVPPTPVLTTSNPIDVYNGTLTDSLPGGSSARGAPANAGGGGTDGAPGTNADNSGGGAGGNGGTGGQGGYGWDSMAATNSTDGGFGGVAFPASTSALVMGGGGGAGTTNNGTYCINYNAGTNTCGTSGNGTGIFSSGGAGGGIGIIHAGLVSGTGTITSNGQSTLSTLNDSTGGAGAGGSIIVFTNSGTLSGLTVNAIGGNGGYAWPIQAPAPAFYSTNNQRHGPGGGGGGGVIFLSAAPTASSVAGGINGYTDTVQDSFGATVGQTGVYATTHVITETPGTQSGAYCASADLSVTNSATPPVVLPGGTITYTQVVANNGPLDAVNAVFTQNVPVNTTVSSITPPAGWSCANTAGTISCTTTSGVFPVNTAGVTFTIAVTVAATAASGAQIVDVANITSGTTDPNLANNTAIAIVTVGSAGTADLAITNSASLATVVAGSPVTLTGVITNQGPSAAAGPVFTETIPANTTFQSFTNTSGWSCSSFAYNGTTTAECVDTSPLAANSTATISFAVLVNAGTPAGTVITATDNVNSATPDPNYSNNSASTTFTVAANSNQADLAVTASASPNPVTQGNNVTFTETVTNYGPATETNATFTVTIPANTTLVSFTPTTSGTSVWSYNTIAVGGTGTFTCSLTNSLATGASNSINFSLVVKVNSGVASGTVISATPSVSSTVGDPNLSNNSATASTIVASPTQSSVRITKTASPEPVNQNSILTYTITVTNSGPAAATGTFTVTDVLPAEVAYIANSYSTSNGTCSGTTTVTCTLNSLAVGSTAVISINVTATTFSAASLSTNTAELTTTSSVPNVPTSLGTATAATWAPDTATFTFPTPLPASVGLGSLLSTAGFAPAGYNATNVPIQSINTTTGVITVALVQSLGTATAATWAAGGGGVASFTFPVPLPAYAVTGALLTTTGFTPTGYDLTNATISSVTPATGVITVALATNPGASTVLGTGTAAANPGASTVLGTGATTYPLYASSVSTIQAPTYVDISSFHAFSQSDGPVVLEWRTHEEARNLGFYVYREDASGRTRINPSLIAGSALLLRGGRPQHAAKIYRWIDPHPVRDAAYWIEDVDINGTRGTHGPAYVESPSAEVAATLASARSSALLSSQRASTVPPSSANLPHTLVVPRPVLPFPPPGLPPLSVADHQAVKISIAQEGWYHVYFAQLFAAGLDRNTDSRTLHLYAEGVEQPLLLIARASGPPSPSDAIEFYGTGIDTPFSADRVYWLISDFHSPKRILPEAAPVSGSSAPASFPFTVLREDRTIYFAALLNGENNDNFFGAIISPEPTDQDLVVAQSDSSSALPISVDVALQGVTDAQQHGVTVQFNGATLGEMDFLGMVLAQQSFPVEPSLLQNGSNTVTLTALNGDNDVSLVQSIALHYAHTYAADADWLRATAYAGSELHLTGFTNPQIRVFDITDPLNISELAAKISPESGAYSAALALSTSAPAVRTILAFANDAISAPVSLAPHVPTFLDDNRTGADVVIITHPDFVASLAPLVRLRESQGHHVSLVTTDQIFDEYNFGERSPFAIRSFLQEAASLWQRKPQSILLVGDASFDPRDYLGLGDFDFVPTRIIETAAFKTASDDWFTDFAQNGFATLPAGRLPVRTPADADLVVSKIIGYESGSSAGSWNSQALLIADQNIDSNFTAAATSAAAALPATLQVSEIFADSLDTATARSQILAALDDGALLVDYNGHGAEQQWSFADLFDTTGAAALTNGGRLPVYLLMDCLNGFFQDVYAESLAESLLLAPNGGAVAVWASSGFTQQAPQSTLNQAFLHLFAANPNQSLGRLVLQAKTGTTDNDVRRTWILFGDPAMKIQFVPAAIPAQTAAPKSQPVTIPVSNRPCLPKAVCSKEKQRQ
ncbi:MAG TPA: C25 family cysteine peptidase [Candidatus Acidoferrum sp.]|nr:C25 family cysteine peptidase [Candidatus Acidoferrum sp.]